MSNKISDVYSDPSELFASMGDDSFCDLNAQQAAEHLGVAKATLYAELGTRPVANLAYLIFRNQVAQIAPQVDSGIAEGAPSATIQGESIGQVFSVAGSHPGLGPQSAIRIIRDGPKIVGTRNEDAIREAMLPEFHGLLHRIVEYGQFTRKEMKPNNPYETVRKLSLLSLGGVSNIYTFEDVAHYEGLKTAITELPYRATARRPKSSQHPA